MLLFLGFLSLLQISFLPGYLCLRSLRLPTRGLIQTVVYSFGLTLLANYLLVYALRTLHLYSAPVLYLVILAEGIALARLLPGGNSGVEIPSEETLTRYKAPWELLAAAPAFGAVLALVWLCYTNFGSVFLIGDDVVSWDRWAIEWSQNRLTTTGYYPQLLPANWSIPYVVMQNIDIKLFNTAIIPLFPLFIALLFLDLFQKTGEAAWLLGLSCFAILLRYVFKPEFIVSGYVEIPNAFFAFLTYYACVVWERSPPSPVPEGQVGNLPHSRGLLLVVAFASATLLVKQGGIYLFVWALGWVGLKIGQMGKAAWRLGLYALLLALALNWWYVAKQWDIIQGLDTNNLMYLIHDIHGGKTYPQRWATSFHMLENMQGPGLAPLFGLSCVLSLLSVFHRRGRFVLLTITAPFYVCWALLFSYQARTLAMDLPFIGYCCGCGLEVVFRVWGKAIRAASTAGKAVFVAGIGATALGAFLLREHAEPWLTGLTANREFNTVILKALLAGACFLPVLALSRRCWPIRVRIPLPLVLGSICIVTMLPAILLNPDEVIREQLEKRKQVGFPTLDRKLYQYAAAHPLEGKIITDYWFLDFAPDLRIHSVTAVIPGILRPEALAKLASRPGVRYVLTASDRFPASTREWMDRNGYVTVVSELGYYLVRFPAVPI